MSVGAISRQKTTNLSYILFISISLWLLEGPNLDRPVLFPGGCATPPPGETGERRERPGVRQQFHPARRSTFLLSTR